MANNNIDDYFINNSDTGYHDRISLFDIRPNPMNFFRKHDEAEEERIQNMAEQNVGKWQKMDLIVYEDEKDDGCHYTLLSGEKRWRMAKYNCERDKVSEMVEVTVLPKPKSLDDEQFSIMQFNNHTQFNKATKLEIVKRMWNWFEENQPEANVTQRSKYIARFLDEESDSYDRTIRNYFVELGLTKGQKSAIEESVDAMEDEEMQEDILRQEELKERLNMVSKEIEDLSTFKSKLKQTKKKGYTLTFSLENIDDLISLLSMMSCEDVNLNGLD